MELDSERIKKPERVTFSKDADERKQQVREAEEEQGVPPARAAADAEEEVAQQSPPDEEVTDPLGEEMAEEFVRVAVGDMDPGDDPAERPPELEEAVVTPANVELAFDEQDVPEDAEPAPEPSPMREKD